MVTSSRYLEAPRRLRAFVRAHETSLILLAALVGTIGGLVVAAMSAAVAGLHVVLFDFEAGERLSSQIRIEPLRALLVPSLGGLLLGMAFLLLLRWRPARGLGDRRPVDDDVHRAGIHRQSRSLAISDRRTRKHRRLRQPLCAAAL